MINFNESTLYISLRSPFARRVRLAFKEHEIEYTEQVIDVFNPPKDYEKINPIMRIPALILKTGEVIVDSNLILQGFYETHHGSLLHPKSEHDAVKALNWSGVAVGLCETLVQWFLETQRPQDKQFGGALQEYKNILQLALSSFEEFIGENLYIADSGLSQADLDMGAALGYFGLRYDSNWQKSFPNASRFFENLNARPAFKATAPPPAVP